MTGKQRWLFFAIIFVLLPPLPAYLDPGSGSVLLSALLGSISLGFFLLRDLWHRITSLGFYQGRHPHAEILVYSEGKQYWPLFRPLIEEFARRGQPCCYWSSDQGDPGLSYQGSGFQSLWIGRGYRAFAKLNSAQADLCVLTTPGLDVLQLRRSKHVKHYSHLIHAPADLHSYLLFSFDYYDSVLLSGPHQIESMRQLEAKRGTPAKKLLPTGLLYYDQAPARETQPEEVAQPTPRQAARILLAPSWGVNSLLPRAGEQLVRQLCQAGYEVWLRPHPQSFVSEAELVDRLVAIGQQSERFELDRTLDVLQTLRQVDLMISDFSGIIFDAAFVAEKPVITISWERQLQGTFESYHLEQPSWESRLLPRIGAQIEVERLEEQLLPAVEHALRQPAGTLAQVREQSVFNFGQAAQVAADQLQDIVKQLRPAADSTT